MSLTYPGQFSIIDGGSSGCISNVGAHSGLGQCLIGANAQANASAIWSVANTALYTPVYVNNPVTIYQLAIEVAVQSGNCDVGIYNEALTRLVSTGSTAVAAAGVQVFNITDTALDIGTYYFAMNCDNITASFRRSSLNAATQRMSGIAQQAVGALALPATATFAVPANNMTPVIFGATKSTTV